MPRHRLTNLPRPQAIIRFPLKADFMAAAIPFDFGLALSLEDGLPRKVYAAAVVAHVHHTLLKELFPDGQINTPRHLQHVRNQGLTSLRGWLDTVEQQAHRPVALVCF